MAPSTADPVAVLRQHVAQGLETQPRVEGGDVVLGDGIRFPRKAKTQFLKQEPDVYYELDAIVFYFLKHELPTGQYIQECLANGIAFIADKDRANVLDYILGKREGAEVQAELETDAPSQASDRVLGAEVKFVDRKNVLHSARPVADLVKKIEDEALGRMRKRGEFSVADKKKLASAHLKVRDPIIVVPAASTAVITRYNVQRFLQDGEFVVSEQAREAAVASGGSGVNITKVKSRKEISSMVDLLAVPVTRTHPTAGSITYRVVDNVKQFTDEDWDRVVAVFVIGQPYQFKNWARWNADPAQVFSHACGIYVHWSFDKLSPTLRSWNVNAIPMKREARSFDGIQCQAIWKAIDEFMEVNHRPLLDALRERNEKQAAAALAGGHHRKRARNAGGSAVQ